MATTPATKKSKPTPNKPASTNPAFTTLKQATCPTLSGSGTIGYEIAVDNNGITLLGLISNSGTGYFSKARQPVTDTLEALEQFQSKHPLTSLALKDLYPGSSINSWGFLMAVLVAEGLVERQEGNLRHFRLCDSAPFLASLDTLKTPKAPHSTPRKRKPKAKA